VAYATIVDVQARLAGRTISSTTHPSTMQVETWIDEGDAKLTATMLAVGLPAPYTSTTARHILRGWVTDYAEGRTRMAFASAGGDGTNLDGQSQVKEFKDLLADIHHQPSMYYAMLSAGAAPESSARVLASNMDDTADDFIDCEFEREQVW
jgi:hypothetical protein